MNDVNEEFDSRAKSVKYLEGYKILITFSNDEKRVFDMQPHLHWECYKQLQDEAFFRKVTVKYGVVQWTDMIDLEPDRAYMESIPVENIVN